MLGLSDLKILQGIFGNKDNAKLSAMFEKRFPETLTVEQAKLQRNGIGVRKKFGILIFYMGFYLPEKTTDPTKAIYMDGNKSVRLLLMRNMHAKVLGESFLQTFLNYDGPEEVKQRCIKMIEELIQALRNGKDANAGEVFHIDMVPKVGTFFYLNDVLVAKTEHFGAFNEAILKVWLGDKCVDSTLKAGMLGTRSI